MLKEIQSLEDQLIYSSNCGSSSLLFTEMMHRTSEWIESNKPNNKLHVSPFKIELDKEVELVAYYIECGYIFDTAVRMIGKNTSDFRNKLTDTHKHILQSARKQRKINKLKNK